MMNQSRTERCYSTAQIFGVYQENLSNGHVRQLHNLIAWAWPRFPYRTSEKNAICNGLLAWRRAFWTRGIPPSTRFTVYCLCRTGLYI